MTETETPAVASISTRCDAWAPDGRNLAGRSVIGPTATIKSRRRHFGTAGPSHTGTLYPDGGAASGKPSQTCRR